jgi:mRNA export factor
MQSPLKWQTRVVSCFTASPNSGFAVGSVEGRVAIQLVSLSRSSTQLNPFCKDISKIRIARKPPSCFHRTSTDHLPRNNFSFKCHRRDSTPNSKDQALVYAVNDISFHPVHGTFSTCGSYVLNKTDISDCLSGSDGTIHFWDKDARTRLKSR